MTKIKMTVPVTMTVMREVWVEFDYTPEERETPFEPGCDAAYDIIEVKDAETGKLYYHEEIEEEEIIQRLEEGRLTIAVNGCEAIR